MQMGLLRINIDSIQSTISMTGTASDIAAKITKPHQGVSFNYMHCSHYKLNVIWIYRDFTNMQFLEVGLHLIPVPLLLVILFLYIYSTTVTGNIVPVYLQI